MMNINETLSKAKTFTLTTVQILIAWGTTYTISWMSTSFMHMDNWLFGIILIPSAVFMGWVSTVATYNVLMQEHQTDEKSPSEQVKPRTKV